MVTKTANEPTLYELTEDEIAAVAGGIVGGGASNVCPGQPPVTEQPGPRVPPGGYTP